MSSYSFKKFCELPHYGFTRVFWGAGEEDPLEKAAVILHTVYCNVNHYDVNDCSWEIENEELNNPWFGVAHKNWYNIAGRLRDIDISIDVLIKISDEVIEKAKENN